MLNKRRSNSVEMNYGEGERERDRSEGAREISLN
jgi:hypothetical protein